MESSDRGALMAKPPGGLSPVVHLGCRPVQFLNPFDQQTATLAVGRTDPS